jgi:hypothetical protein
MKDRAETGRLCLVASLKGLRANDAVCHLGSFLARDKIDLVGEWKIG